jgi:5'-nucleotidase
MKNLFRRLASVLVSAAMLTACSTPPAPPLVLNLVALNDFHGNLEAGKFTYTGVADPKPQSIQAGGIDNLGAALQAWRAEDKDLMLVGAGDLVGASPAMSSMWADEPTVVALGMLGMRVSSVGNHEFDLGRAELLRQQNGGCVSSRPEKACKLSPQFDGARFTYLAANVIDQSTGKPFLPGYRIEDIKGVKVAFIGAVLKDAAGVVLASGIAGLRFIDEADAINQAAGEARAHGATVFVVLIHEGGETDEAIDKPDCTGLKGPIVGIARRLDPALRLIITGHTHKGFQCKLGERVITQAEMGGHVLSRIALKIDPATRTVRDIAVRNVVVKPGQYPPDPAITSYLASVRERSNAALARPIARVSVRSMLKKGGDSGESALGDLIADAALAATRGLGAQIAFMNAAGIRKDFEVGETMVATFGQAQIVLPFSNTLVLMDLTGAELRALLEQQWQRQFGAEGMMLQVSHGFRYRWDDSRPPGQKVTAISLDGVPIDAARTYRVTANNFLAEGGDGFPAFAAGRNKFDTHIKDVDALIDFLVKNDRAGSPAGQAAPAGRIERIGTASRTQ